MKNLKSNHNNSLRAMMASWFPVVAMLAQSHAQTPTQLAAPAIEEWPEPLRLALDARNALRTARIEWALAERSASAPSGGVRTRRFSSECAANMYLITHLGDEQGVFFRDPQGKPEEHDYCTPMSCLRDGERIWTHRESAPMGDLWSADMSGLFDVVDPRAFGLEPTEVWRGLSERFVKAGLPPLRYSVEKRNEIVIVTAQSAPTRTPKSTFVWELDSTKGFAPIHMQRLYEPNDTDKFITHIRIKLDKFDGHWFPESISVFDSDNHGKMSDEPTRAIQVKQAEFNRPEHKTRLGPADIGIEPGMMVMPQGQPRIMDGRVIWDGNGLITQREYRERRENGTISSGPTLVRALAHAAERRERAERMMQEGKIDPEWESLMKLRRKEEHGEHRRFENSWERYTREFIEKHRLADEETQRAWRICRECTERAIEYLRPHDAHLSKLEADFLGAADPSGRERAQAELTKILTPIELIFENRLKPGLEKLVPRQNRMKSVAPSAASQPSR